MPSKLKAKAKKLEEQVPISESLDVALKNSKGEVINARHTDSLNLRSIPNLEIEISSSQGDDEALLHQLLNKTRETK